MSFFYNKWYRIQSFKFTVLSLLLLLLLHTLLLLCLWYATLHYTHHITTWLHTTWLLYHYIGASNSHLPNPISVFVKRLLELSKYLRWQTVSFIYVITTANSNLKTATIIPSLIHIPRNIIIIPVTNISNTNVWYLWSGGASRVW